MSMGKKKTTEDFVRDASHISGHGCPMCKSELDAKKNSCTKEKFLKISRQKFGDKFDYTRLNYVDCNTSINLVCSVHGKSFNIKPIKHIRNKTGGCPVCGKELSLRRQMPLEKFLRLANERHKNRYDYSKTKYGGIKKHIEIECPLHGAFIKSPEHHLSGQGCPKCSNERKSKEHIIPFETFVERAKMIYSDLYGYEKSGYVKITAPISLECKKHGPFTVLAKDHLNGQHCPKCKVSKGEQKIMSVLNTYSISYEREKKFEDLKVKKMLRYDFYLPEYNMCVEYHGIQHYKIVTKYKMTDESLRQNKRRDKLKKRYCRKNSIQYLCIPYFDFNSIETILISKLLENKLTN